MPSYTPPAYNAVVFNFTIGAYTPPTYNTVVFNFGGGAPVTATPLKKRSLAHVVYETEEWMPTPRRRVYLSVAVDEINISIIW